MKEDYSYLKPMQDALLKSLKFFVSLCEQHNLQYWVAGGTCIGAIRHKGFIPWDDDIDVYMPQKDYEKLLTLKEEIESEDHYLLTHYTPGYYYQHAKLCYNKTTLWEREKDPFVFGTFIDIFPLSQTDKNEEDIRKTYNHFNYSTYKVIQVNKHYPLSSLIDKLYKKDLEGFIRDFKWLMAKPFLRHILIKKLKKEEEALDLSKGETLIPYTDTLFGVLIFPREWFDGYHEAEFEGIKVRAPKNYDAYLRHIYGDYMQLPPEDKRHSVHDHFYINLNEGLKLNEVRYRMKHNN